jgi:pyrimidine-nucleoside phosphorylase
MEELDLNTTRRSMLDLIERTKRRQGLTSEELRWLVQAYVDEELPEYQVAAWLMAVLLTGLGAEETIGLTEALVASGRRLDLAGHGVIAADKHSTGGIGDKTTLVLAPLVAAAGLPVAKMSGRGLGFTGGTLDKLESVPGLRVDLSAAQFVRHAQTTGLVIAGQTPDLAPGDGKLYALRDVTGTVDSIPLIAASVMSKKIAAGARFVVLDVKMGNGAFMELPEAARELARTMLTIGRAAGLEMAAALSWMDQPLGGAIGNALEMAEAIQTLRGNGPDDVRDLCFRLGIELLRLSGMEPEEAAARRRLETALASGAALAKLQEMILAQAGDPAVADAPQRLPHAPVQVSVCADQPGYVRAIAARTLGYVAIALGAGRTKKDEKIDHATGIILHAKVGALVAVGDRLATVHASSPDAAAQAIPAVRAAYALGAEPPAPRPLVAEVLR